MFEAFTDIEVKNDRFMLHPMAKIGKIRYSLVPLGVNKTDFDFKVDMTSDEFSAESDQVGLKGIIIGTNGKMIEFETPI